MKTEAQELRDNGKAGASKSLESSAKNLKVASKKAMMAVDVSRLKTTREDVQG